MKKFLFLVTVLIVLYGGHLMAQAPPGLPTTPSQTPIDGGLTLLLLAGGWYAVRKLLKENK